MWYAIETGSEQFGAPLTTKSRCVLAMFTFCYNNKRHEYHLKTASTNCTAASVNEELGEARMGLVSSDQLALIGMTLTGTFEDNCSPQPFPYIKNQLTVLTILRLGYDGKQ